MNESAWDSSSWNGSSSLPVGLTALQSAGRARGIDPGRSTGLGAVPGNSPRIDPARGTGALRLEPGRSTGKGR